MSEETKPPVYLNGHQNYELGLPLLLDLGDRLDKGATPAIAFEEQARMYEEAAKVCHRMAGLASASSDLKVVADEFGVYVRGNQEELATLVSEGILTLPSDNEDTPEQMLREDIAHFLGDDDDDGCGPATREVLLVRLNDSDAWSGVNPAVVDLCVAQMMMSKFIVETDGVFSLIPETTLEDLVLACLDAGSGTIGEIYDQLPHVHKDPSSLLAKADELDLVLQQLVEEGVVLCKEGRYSLVSPLDEDDYEDYDTDNEGLAETTS